MKIEKIHIDTREDISSIDGYEYEISMLGAADYVIEMSDGRNVYVERKQVKTGDLFTSIYDGKMVRQCYAMSKIAKYSILWIDGNMIQHGNKVAIPTTVGRVAHLTPVNAYWNLVQSHLMAVQSFGVYVWQSAFGIQSLLRIAVPRVLASEVKPTYASLGAKDQATTILTSIPGIGVKRASKLIEAHGFWGAMLKLKEEGKLDYEK